MPFVDVGSLNIIERLPGWYGRYFHSANMTFAHYDFKRGSSIHEHFHAQEEVYEVVEGELIFKVGGETITATAELLGIDHARALKSGIVHRFVGADYGWMWPFPKTIERWFDEHLARINL